MTAPTVAPARATLVDVHLDGRLLALVGELERVTASTASPQRRADAAARSLADAMSVPAGWLPAPLLTTSPDGYRANLAHLDARGRFSVVVMAWLPGQRTPIHDHVTWCASAVYAGRERNVRYRLHRDAGGPWLEESDVEEMGAGAVTVLVPPDEDIHHVECASASAAVSIHVYGADISARGTSINRTFDGVPVRVPA